MRRGRAQGQESQEGLAREKGGRAFIHQHSRTPDIIYDNDSVTTRAFVPMSIDLMWFCTSCMHLGDLQLTPYPPFKGEALWFIVSGEEVSHSHFS